MDFQKIPPPCARIGRSKNHIAKSILKQENTPLKHMGRIVPLHLVKKVKKRTTETNRRQPNHPFGEMTGRIIHNNL